MKLEQFREIADENLKDLAIDERMVKRIRQSTCTVKVSRRPKVPRAAAYVAAACVMVMLLSGGVLITTMGDALRGNRSVPDGEPAALYSLQMEDGMVSTLSASLETSQYIDGSTLSYGIAKVGTLSEEGYAAAQATNGLYGYVNADHVWVVRAMYDDAQDVVEGKAAVSVQGTTQIIDVPPQ